MNDFVVYDVELRKYPCMEGKEGSEDNGEEVLPGFHHRSTRGAENALASVWKVRGMFLAITRMTMRLPFGVKFLNTLGKGAFISCSNQIPFLSRNIEEVCMWIHPGKGSKIVRKVMKIDNIPNWRSLKSQKYVLLKKPSPSMCMT